MCFIFATTDFIYADELETEITLFEVVETSIIGGNDPLDNPSKGTDNPTRPNQFHATIAGRTLAISVDNDNLNIIIVRNNVGAVVINHQFVGYCTELLTSEGEYTIEISNSSFTLVGQFYAE